VKVKRIVSNVATSDVDKASAFYKEILGLKVLMDLGWIRTYGSSSKMTIQVSLMSEGGSGTAVPDMSIEVDILGSGDTIRNSMPTRAASAGGLGRPGGSMREPRGRYQCCDAGPASWHGFAYGVPVSRRFL
jgi:catechol 2,3-dioxygenase-like lactoylglutathione lyase family enzyme